MAPARPHAAARLIGDGGEQGFQGSLWSPPSDDGSPNAAETTTGVSTNFIEITSFLCFLIYSDGPAF